MYLVFIYIIIVFTLILFCKTVEGQEVTSNMSDENLEELYKNLYKEELNADDIRSKQIEIELIDKEIVLQVYLVDTVNELKNILSKYDNIKIPIERMELIYDDLVLRDNYMLFEYGIVEGDKIHLEDSIKIIGEFGRPDSKLFRQLYGEDEKEYIDPYERYMKEFLKFNKAKRKKSDKIYSQRISELFKNKSEPYLKPYNKYNYLDNNINEKLKKDDEDELVGPSPYIDSPELYDRIMQVNNESNDNNNDLRKGEEMCCQRSSLNIINPKLISDNINVNTIRPDKLYESSMYGDFEAYNSPYYDYMETENKKYESLYGDMRKIRKPGSLNP
jgi:hypothetical protein